ncbi:hypothetical protein QJS04_geneDACA007921 [Acorus gramineus]|uniref:Uncharacterized protein n=1 Tax=Acorus gramineus TaxID=55184 RepID=A0AAV9BB89_ACOGR|nr:hypothetical protein QJS04_geneDACA007921 [Acorus gramineus]
MNDVVPIDLKLKAFIFKKLKTKLRTVYDWKDYKRGRRGVTRDWSKSVLLDACSLAQSLNNKKKEKWKIISAVWAEMLCYAASQCRGYRHAQRLSKGGESFHLSGLLMAHLGIGDMYHREAHQFKLIVEK